MSCKKTESYIIEGKQSNSASPTDTWKKTYYDDKGNVVCKTFLKIWVSNIDGMPFSSLRTSALDYEAKVYEQIKTEIIDTNLSHSFVEIVDYSENNTFDDMLNQLVKGISAQNLSILSEFEDDITNVLRYNLQRNLVYMTLGEKNRPDIYKYNPLPTDLYKEISRLKSNKIGLNAEENKIRINYIETKDLSHCVTLASILSSKLKRNKYGKDAIIILISELLTAVDMMNSHGIYQQDLHFGNVLVDLELNMLYVYDFDRSYSIKIGNNISLQEDLTSLCSLYGQCNEEHPIKDFMKIICILFYYEIITLEDFQNIIYTENNKITKSHFNSYVIKSGTCHMDKEAFIEDKFTFRNRKDMTKRVIQKLYLRL
jgi:hypothetical protein